MDIRPGIKLLEDVEGVGEQVTMGDVVQVMLNGWLSGGEQFQTNHIESIRLGSRRVIPGIEYAIEGMKMKGIRKVKISPHLGYKHNGVAGLIPPDALLIYEIEVLSVQSNK